MKSKKFFVLSAFEFKRFFHRKNIAVAVAVMALALGMVQYGAYYYNANNARIAPFLEVENQKVSQSVKTRGLGVEMQ